MPQVLLPVILTAVGGVAAGATATAILVSSLITGVLSAASMLLAKKAAQVDPQELKSIVRSSAMPRRDIYGERRVSGLLAYAGISQFQGTKEENEVIDNNFYLVLVVADHEVENIGEVIFKDLVSYDDEFRNVNEMRDYFDNEWISGTTYSLNDMVRWPVEDGDVTADTDETRFWRWINPSDGVSTTSPLLDNDNWEETGWWYAIRRHRGQSGQTVDTMLQNEPVPKARHELYYERQGLGYNNNSALDGYFWEDEKTFDNLAYVIIQIRYNMRHKVWNGPVPDVSMVVKGRKDIYDPRTQTTAWTDNPMLCLCHYLTTEKGLGIEGIDSATSEIFKETVPIDADYCDVLLFSIYRAKEVSTTLTAAATTFTDNDGTTYQDFTKFEVSALSPPALYKIRLVTDTPSVYIGYIGGTALVDYTINVYINSTLSSGGWELEGSTFGEGDGGGAVIPSGNEVSYIVYDVDITNTCEEKRFTINAVVSSDEKPIDVAQNMLASMGGRMVWSDGQYRIVSGRYLSPSATLTDDDVYGNTGIKLSALVPRKDVYNTVRGKFVDKENGWNSTEFPSVSNTTYVTNDNGVTLPISMELPYTLTSSMAQRIGLLALKRAREEITLTFPGSYHIYPLSPLQTVEYDSDIFWENLSPLKEFTVESWDMDHTKSSDPGGVQLVLKETIEADYSFSFSEINPTYLKDRDDVETTTVILPPTNVQGNIVGEGRNNWGNLTTFSMEVTWDTPTRENANRRYDVLSETADNEEEKTGNGLIGDTPGTISLVDTPLVLTDTAADFSNYVGFTKGLPSYRIQLSYDPGGGTEYAVGYVKQLSSLDPTKIEIYSDVDMLIPGWQYILSAISGIISYKIYLAEFTRDRQDYDTTAGGGTTLVGAFYEVINAGASQSLLIGSSNKFVGDRTYNCHVRYIDAGTSAYTNWVSDINFQYSASLPPIISGFQAYNVEGSSLVILIWDMVNYNDTAIIDHYYIKQVVDSTLISDWTTNVVDVAVNVDPDNTWYQDSSLNPTNTYYIKAVNGAGESTNFTEAKVIPINEGQAVFNPATGGYSVALSQQELTDILTTASSKVKAGIGDGTTDAITLGYAYTSGSTRLYVDGTLMISDTMVSADGTEEYTETSSTSGTISPIQKGSYVTIPNGARYVVFFNKESSTS